jgi:hypothetical protein
MSNKHTLIIVTILVMLIMLAVPAAAITFGEPDGEGHPYVGLAVFFDENNNFLWPCSGTLLSPDVFLTAGHCTYGTAWARVWLETDLTRLESPVADCDSDYCSDGDTFVHENYLPSLPQFPNTYDVGIVVLDEPIDIEIYGEIPEQLYVLDDLATRRGQQDRIIRTVGYGWQMVKPTFQWEPVRYTSTSMLVNLRSHLTDGYNIHTSNNPGKGQGTGGSCFGDSGGPILYPEDSNLVVGIVSFGLNSNCKGAGFAYRTDIEEAQDFIREFIE